MNNRFVSFALFCFIPRRQPGNKYLLGECIVPYFPKKIPLPVRPEIPKRQNQKEFSEDFVKLVGSLAGS